MRLEYLISFRGGDSFCDSKEAFVKLLEVDSRLSISGSSVSYQNAQGETADLHFSLHTDTVPTKDERYFLITIALDDETQVDTLAELGVKVKSVAARVDPAQTVINTLWDDVGRHYAQLAYPLINEVENLMRKLISQFMLINVGMNWSEDNVPAEQQEKIKAFKAEPHLINDLAKLDFIHLSDVLFKKKRDLGLNELDRLLQRTSFSPADQEEILKVLPRSNWEKHFSELLGVAEDKFSKKWELLYGLRNDVAHNRFISKETFQKISGLCRDVKEILDKAVSELGRIELGKEERQRIKIDFQPRQRTIIDLPKIYKNPPSITVPLKPGQRRISTFVLRNTLDTQVRYQAEVTQGEAWLRIISYSAFIDVQGVDERDLLEFEVDVPGTYKGEELLGVIRVTITDPSDAQPPDQNIVIRCGDAASEQTNSGVRFAF